MNQSNRVKSVASVRTTYYEDYRPNPDSLESGSVALANRVSEIFDHVPGHYEILPVNSRSCRIISTSGLQLYAFATYKHYGDTEPDRIEFSVNMQKCRGYTYYGDQPKIGVSPARSIEQIASDIERRLLPEAQAFFKAECDYLDDIEANGARKDWMLKMLSEFLGEEPSSHRERTIYTREEGERADIEVRSADNVKITLEYMDLESALTILEAVFPERARLWREKNS